MENTAFKKFTTDQHAEFTQAVLENSPVGIMVYELEGQCIFANKSIAETLGAPIEKLLHQNFNEIASWKSSGLLEAANIVIRSHQRKSGELKLTTSFGKAHYLQYSFQLARIDSVEYLVCHFQDLTEKTLLVQSVQESQSTLRSIFEYAPIPFMFFDSQGILDCNVAAVKDLGL